MLTSVSNAVVEPDLAERCVTLHLSHIAQRRSEARLWKEFERERPAIFGALLDIIAHGLKQLQNTASPATWIEVGFIEIRSKELRTRRRKVRRGVRERVALLLARPPTKRIRPIGLDPATLYPCALA
jgi:hypothetical protein